MLHVSGMVLGNTSPAILGHLSKNIRIAVLKTPLVDEDVGVAASIRIVNAQKLKKEDFLRSGTAADEMMELMSALVRYGVSTTVAGATSSGKTTLTGWLLTTIPHDKRIFTIENGSRELDLVERDKNGKIINKVIHTITRESEDEKKSITQDNLLDMALRFHPDYIVVGEMRSSEADSAQEAARTGHTVITTIHSNSCESTWCRMVTLCKRKYPNVDDKVILNLVTEAFPIVVYAKQLENKQRRIMEIMECEILPDGARNIILSISTELPKAAGKTVNSLLPVHMKNAPIFRRPFSADCLKTVCRRTSLTVFLERRKINDGYTFNCVYRHGYRLFPHFRNIAP